ncbi:hypothetical protein Tco_0728370 [Tanacetum coccineum]|uniref:Integrase, catalytic region, zinc finger, CCHC-type, peptidase aspartic, catalytic n=1 Tax=Tanacetum coccineum TaxID=301880 RepID=A0ABQ4YKZ3_9ASTR
MTRYLLQKLRHAAEEMKVRSLPLNHPLNSYSLHTLRMKLESDTRISNIMEAPREEFIKHRSDGEDSMGQPSFGMMIVVVVTTRNTLAEYMILSRADNRPPMLDKDMYDSWKVEENGVTRTKKYAKLSAAKKIQADCDMKATNNILQGLIVDIYSLVNHHSVAKDLWERVQLLMQGTSLTKQERECKLYDAFDNFTHIRGESLHKYYLRFTQLINDINIYNIKMEQFQVSTKFLNSLPPEWSKFVTNVKLVKDLHTANFDQLHAYFEQHELHANEVCLLRERNQDPLAFVAN